MTNRQKSLVYPQLPALALFSAKDTAVLKSFRLFAITAQIGAIDIDVALRWRHQQRPVLI
jgi:hypothetical protein